MRIGFGNETTQHVSCRHPFTFAPLNDETAMSHASTPGIVLCSYGKECLVEDAQRALRVCQLRRSVGRPVCGDRVRIGQDEQSQWVSEICTRRNEFARGDRRGRPQVIAANVDQALICIAPEPAPTRDLINRYLIACHANRLSPAVVVNKSDLQPDLAALDHMIHEVIRDSDIPVLHCSAKQQIGLAEVQDLIRGQTSILVGQSGVGKSSLINALVPDLDLQTSRISDNTGKGRHTTTSTTLYRIGDDDSTALIDSPGVWEYGLWQMSTDQIAAGFPDFATVLGDCRFNDCSHRHEPGCALISAARSGQIDPVRYEAYLRIVEANDRMYGKPEY